MALGFLKKGGYVTLAAKAGSRLKFVLPEASALEARASGEQRLNAIERRWLQRYGERNIQALRDSLVRICADGTAERSALFGGLHPPADSWRASVRPPITLPHYPMVLHRGGYPDGS
jgi:hypothetical protein